MVLVLVLDGLDIIAVQFVDKHYGFSLLFMGQNSVDQIFGSPVPAANNDMIFVLDGFQTLSLLDLLFHEDGRNRSRNQR